MPISFECTGCGKKLKIKDESAGKRIKCPECQAVLNAPKPQKKDEDDFLGGLDEAVKQVKKRPPAAIEDDDDDDDVEDYDDAPRASAPKRRTKKTASKKSSGSGSAGRVFGAIGGGLVTLLVILGVIGKVAKVARLGEFMNQSVSWQHFRHPTGGASIDMPGLATLNVKASTDPSAQVYTCNSRNFACSLTAVSLPPQAMAGIAINPSALDAVFAGMKQGMMNFKPGARLISETRIQQGATQGMELRIEYDNVVNVSRSYVTNSHLIACEIVFKKGSEPVADRDRYFSSVQLTGAPVGGATPMPGMTAPIR